MVNGRLTNVFIMGLIVFILGCSPKKAIVHSTAPAQTVDQRTPVAGNIGKTNVPDFIFGALDKRPDLTFEQRKTIRVANAILLREKAKWAMEQGQALQLPAGRLEIELLKDPVIAIGKGQKLQLSGVSDEETVIMCYPLVRPHREEVFIDHLPGAHLNLEQITVARPDSNRWETYEAQWTATGDSLYNITLTHTNLRPGWHNHLIGQTIFYSYNDKKVGGKLTVVQVHPEAHALIAKGVMPAEEPVLGQQRVAWDFPADIQPHLYRQYGALWYETGTSSTAIKHLEGHPLKQPGTLNLNHFTSHNFSYCLSRSGGQFDLKIENSRIQAQEVALSFYVGNEVNMSIFYIDSLVIHHSGFKSMGDISPNISADKIWGSGGYLHPNVTVKANRLYCLDNAAGAWRQYSGSGKKPFPEGNFCEYRNSTFARNGEYNLFLSSSMPSQVIECTFAEGNNKVGVATRYTGCSFVNESVHGYPISEPQTDGFDSIVFRFCTFKNSVLALQWKKYGQSVVVKVVDSKFEFRKGGKFVGAFVEVAFGLYQLDLINNQFYLDPKANRVPNVSVLDNIASIILEGNTSNAAQEAVFACRKNCDATQLKLGKNDLQFAMGLGVETK